MPKRAPEKCQARILDAAERTFADGGYNGASMRDIVQAAGVNLATVYYYFGSKRGLMDAVLKRRFGPLRQEHLQVLRQFERENQGQPLPVEKIVEAMLCPPLRLVAAPAAKRQAVTRLMGRIATEPDPQIQEILRSQRSEVRAAFLKAFRASLPGASPAELQWRIEFVWGALAFILCKPRAIEIETHGACNPEDARTVLAEMVDFFSAGFRAVANHPRLGPHSKCPMNPEHAASNSRDLSSRSLPKNRSARSVCSAASREPKSVSQ